MALEPIFNVPPNVLKSALENYFTHQLNDAVSIRIAWYRQRHSINMERMSVESLLNFFNYEVNMNNSTCKNSVDSLMDLIYAMHCICGVEIQEEILNRVRQLTVDEVEVGFTDILSETANRLYLGMHSTPLQKMKDLFRQASPWLQEAIEVYESAVIDESAVCPEESLHNLTMYLLDEIQEYTQLGAREVSSAIWVLFLTRQDLTVASCCWGPHIHLLRWGEAQHRYFEDIQRPPPPRNSMTVIPVEREVSVVEDISRQLFDDSIVSGASSEAAEELLESVLFDETAETGELTGEMLLMTPVCTARHKMTMTQYHVEYGAYSDGFQCDMCNRHSSAVPLSGGMYRRWCCRSCQYDICFDCYPAQDVLVAPASPLCSSGHQMLHGALPHAFTCTICLEIYAQTERRWYCSLCHIEHCLRCIAEVPILCRLGHEMIQSATCERDYRTGTKCEDCLLHIRPRRLRWFCMDCGVAYCFTCVPQ